MRLTVLGGGGFRVPLVYRALLGQHADGGSDTRLPGRRVHEVVLADVDPQRLDVIRHVLHQLAADAPAAPQVRVTTRTDEALEGADVVFCAIRVGGLVGRTVDERVALEAGVLGQETTGAGGVCYGLRTVPVAMRIAEQVARLAPHAWVVNFTNPAGMVTEAMSRVLGDRVIGICDTPAGMGNRVARVLGVDRDRLWLDYVGLNHLGWLRGAWVDGHDKLPGLLAEDDAVQAMDPGGLFGPRWLRALGALPNEYLHYYYFQADALRAIQAAEQTRGTYLLEAQTAFYAEAARHPDRALAEWRRVLQARERTYMAESMHGGARDDDVGGSRDSAEHASGGYEDVAVALMSALTGAGPSSLILNVRNRGAVTGFDRDAVVEVPCLVDTNGAHPVSAGAVAEAELGLMQTVKSVERTTIVAALSGSRDRAVRAFAMHPLVGSVGTAEQLLDAYLAEVPSLAEVFSGPDGSR